MAQVRDRDGSLITDPADRDCPDNPLCDGTGWSWAADPMDSIPVRCVTHRPHTVRRRRIPV